MWIWVALWVSFVIFVAGCYCALVGVNEPNRAEGNPVLAGGIVVMLVAGFLVGSFGSVLLPS